MEKDISRNNFAFVSLHVSPTIILLTLEGWGWGGRNYYYYVYSRVPLLLEANELVKKWLHLKQ